MIKSYKHEIIGSIICLGLGLASGLSVGAGDSAWYLNLTKPSFNPPSWIFGPVWTVLYIMMGVALGKIWKIRDQQPSLMILFLIQFFFNLLWSPLFFFFHKIDFALVDIVVLWVSLGLLVKKSFKHQSIFILMLPYFCWVSFAVVLTFFIYKMNVVQLSAN